MHKLRKILKLFKSALNLPNFSMEPRPEGDSNRFLAKLKLEACHAVITAGGQLEPRNGAYSKMHKLSWTRIFAAQIEWVEKEFQTISLQGPMQTKNRTHFKRIVNHNDIICTVLVMLTFQILWEFSSAKYLKRLPHAVLSADDGLKSQNCCINFLMPSAKPQQTPAMTCYRAKTIMKM